MAEAARFIWADATGTGRNRYVAFRRTFALDERPTTAMFHLFADTRYRLIVNGETVCHGPARFVLSHPEYDSIDIARYLRVGQNVVAVLVNSFGSNSFHSDVSVGGMICWGLMGTGPKAADLASGRAWRCMPLDAYREDTHPMSFALNPAEHLDARKLPAGWEQALYNDGDWPVATIHENSGNWGELRSRSIPMLDERAILPVTRMSTFAARGQAGEKLASCAMIVGSGEQRARATLIIGTWIHSPKKQDVILGAWWGEYRLNGRKLEPMKRHDVPLRQDFPAELEEGWNLLLVRETWGQDAWVFYLGYPEHANLKLSADRTMECKSEFAAAGPWLAPLSDSAMKLPLDASTRERLPQELGEWCICPPGGASSPVRERAWKSFEQLDATAELTCDGALYAEQIGPDTLCLLYDFGTEVLGRLRLDFKAAAGTIVDATYTERLRNDGVSDVHNRFFQDMAERYIAVDGLQRWHSMHPRGGRYVEVLVTGDLAEFQLNAIAMTRASYPVEPVGSMTCGDPLLNSIWDLGRRTEAACMEDAYLDCPMRERGLYAGDMLVQYLVNLAAFGDHRLLRRCIEIFLYRQSPENGLISGGAQGLPTGRHPDYSAILVQAIWQYYWRSGDRDFLDEISPALQKMLVGLESLKVAGSDLLDGSDLHPYIDLEKMDRGGINCALNCFYQKAFTDAALIFTTLGDIHRAEHYRSAGAKLAAAIRAEFWDDQRDVFTDRRKVDVENTQPSVAANSLGGALRHRHARAVAGRVQLSCGRDARELHRAQSHQQQRVQRHQLLLLLRDRGAAEARAGARVARLHAQVLGPHARAGRLDLLGVLHRRTRQPLPCLVGRPDALSLHAAPGRELPRAGEPHGHPGGAQPRRPGMGRGRLSARPGPDPHPLAQDRRRAGS